MSKRRSVLARILDLNSPSVKSDLVKAAQQQAGKQRAANVVDQIAREMNLLHDYEQRLLIVEMGIDFRKRRIQALQAGEFSLVAPNDQILYHDAELNNESVIVGQVSIGL